MVRAPCCEKIGLKKGPWTRQEDQCLISYIQQNGHPNWRALPKLSGLLRCGKSCRLRWTNYLKPDIKRGNFSKEEEETIIQLHESIGNRWSAMAAKLPGRTDNEIKNVWHTHIKKKLKDYKSTQDTKRPKNKKQEPQPGKPDSSTSKEIDSPGYGSISPISSSSEISSVTTDADIIQQELSPSSTVPLTEFEKSLCLTDIPDDQEMTAWLEIDEGMECLKGDDDMSFWYNLLLTAEELPEF